MFIETLDYKEIVGLLHALNIRAQELKRARNQARSALRNDVAMMFMGGDPPSPSLERLNARVCDFEQAIEADAVAQLTCNKFTSALEACAVGTWET